MCDSQVECELCDLVGYYGYSLTATEPANASVEDKGGSKLTAYCLSLALRLGGRVLDQGLDILRITDPEHRAAIVRWHNETADYLEEVVEYGADLTQYACEFTLTDLYVPPDIATTICKILVTVLI